MKISFEEKLEETERAYLFGFDAEEGEEIWIPKSCCKNLDEDNLTVEVEDWIVEDKDLEWYEA